MRHNQLSHRTTITTSAFSAQHPHVQTIRHIALGVALLLLAFSHTHAATLHNESVFGDYADDESVAPSDLGVFQVGVHTITGVFGDDGNNNDDGDVFTFTAPTGTVITSVSLTTYDILNGNPGNGSFFAIAAGPTIGTTLQTMGSHLSNMLIHQTGELLDDLENGAFSGISTLTTPLPANAYTVFLHETAAGIAFAMDVTVAPIPEPTTLALILLTLPILAHRKRRPLTQCGPDLGSPRRAP